MIAGGASRVETFLASILEIFRSKSSDGFALGSVSLTGTPTSLPSFNCKAIEFLSSCTITRNSISVSYTGGILPCTNTSDILVSGSGTLNYIIYL